MPASLPISTVLGLNDYAYFVTPHVGKSGTSTITTASSDRDERPADGVAHAADVVVDLRPAFDEPRQRPDDGDLRLGRHRRRRQRPAELRAENQLPQVPITTKSYGSTSTPDTSGDGATVEWELDTQASTGMAPNVTGETLYFGHHNTDADILAAMTAWANDRKGPLQASASFGECENIPAAEPAIGVDGLKAPATRC